jgi:PAS domain S-box-containing protein
MERISTPHSPPSPTPGAGTHVDDALFLQSIIENIPYMIFVKDAADLRFVRFNRAGEALLGYSRHELIGRSDGDFFPVEEAAFFTRQDRAVLRGRTVVDIPEEPIRTRRLGLRYLHTKKIPIFDRQGDPRYLLGISEDITELKAVQAELRRAREAAEAASRAKTDFLARMSHEIRTPMNGIIGMTELALSTELTDEQREYLTMVRESAQSLLAIVNDILDFSKIETGRLELESVLFDVRRCVEKTVQAFGVQARDKALRLEVDVAADVPRAVVGDPVRLRQVLVNLIDNAIRFTDAGRVGVRVRVRKRGPAEATLAFTVIDTGIGIPEEKRRVIFEAFAQADESTTRVYGGTGLGLAISSRLVEMMGGRISVATRPGKGSRFQFTARLGISAGRIALESRAAPKAAPRLAPKRVLVAEDNRVNRLLIVRFLEQEGHEVIVAESGAEVIGALRHDPVDLILMDLEMPNLGGLETTRHIRAAEKRRGGHVPIIALTAHAMSGYREKCLEAGMDGYIAKPVSKQELLGALARFLPRRAPAAAATPAPRVPAPAGGASSPWGSDMIDLFGRTTRRELAQMEGLIRRGKLERARVMAHNIVGVAGLLGMRPAVETARRLEAAAKRGDPARARVLCRELRTTVDRLAPSLGT